MNSQEVLRDLESFRELEPNWDSYGGHPISKAAIDAASNLVEGLFVCPLPSGEVAISLGEDIMLRATTEGGVVLELV